MDTEPIGLNKMLFKEYYFHERKYNYREAGKREAGDFLCWSTL